MTVITMKTSNKKENKKVTFQNPIIKQNVFVFKDWKLNNFSANFLGGVKLYSAN